MGAIRAFVAAVSLWAAMGVQAEPAPPEPLRQLLQHAQASTSVRVLVGAQLAEPFRPEAELDLAQGTAQRGRIATAQDRIAELIAGLGGHTRIRYRFVPYLAAEVPASALRELIGSPWVANVSADRLRQPTLLRSTALIGADQAWRAGLTGAGWTVALPDTGIDGTHPFLAGKVVVEACDSSTWVGNGLQPATVSLCPGGAESSTQAGAGSNCDATLADCDHGTLAAGIVAGRNGPDGLSGVAPEATLIALQIYSRRADGSGIGAWDSDLIKALERVYALRDTQRIAAVNLSLAGSEIYADPSTCDTEHPALADAIELLRSAGIATVAAAGNEGSTTALAAPACLSNAISVGASCTAGPDASFCANGPDSIATYSNVSSFLSLLAPGSYITSSIPGNGYETLSGTSMAAPHVAGALALLRQHSPDAAADELLQRLREAAASIDDTRSGGTARALMLMDVRGLIAAATVEHARTDTGTSSAGTATATASTSSSTARPPVVADAVDSTQAAPESAGLQGAGGVAAAAVPVSASSGPIAAGAVHTCALTSGGGVKCWGYNEQGQLGDGSTTSRLTPVNVVGLSSGVVAVVADYHTCALTTGGGVKCWGDNWAGQLGDGSTTSRSTPVDVTGLSSGVAALAVGWSHTCALTTGGGVKCWGDNWAGQLGDGSTTSRLAPVDVPGLSSGVAAIAAGGDTTCALTSGGGVKCWGYNYSGQLGDGTTTSRSAPVDVAGLSSGIAAVAPGSYHTCALTNGGGVKCWGRNDSGQLGDNSTTQRLTPVNVVGLSSGVVAVVADSHTCALTSGGGVKCWGYNEFGQLGDNSTTNRLAPVEVVGLSSGVVAITAGGIHTCALASAGGVKCWGGNWNGQLGDGSTTDRWTPVDVVGLGSGPEAITTGDSHTCVLTTGGAVQCWGWNYYGQLGDNSTTQRLTPVGVAGLGSGVSAIVAGQYHTCALASGGVKCWGYNLYGQLGDNSTTQRLTPVNVAGLSSSVVAIAAGGLHSCALTSGGGVKCWGDNGYGQLGDNTTTGRLTPVDVVGLGSGVAAIAAGQYHTCALTSGGAVKCWGRNGSGQLGDGTTTQRLTAVNVVGLASGVAAIDAADSHTCVQTGSGGIQCWGGNTSGQLGDGTKTQRLTPVSVVGLGSGAAAIAAGGLHTCALTSGGGVKCWGYNDSGQLGDNSTTDRLTPVDVSGLSSGVAAIAAGSDHTCALTTGGPIRCWGYNAAGQLGDGSTTQRLTPVGVVGLAPDVAPDAFGFAPQIGVATGATVTSETITPGGYSTPSSIAIDNGQYSIGCGGSFTISPGTISPGQSVCVRHTASASPSTMVTTTLTIGGVNGTFSSTTVGSVVPINVNRLTAGWGFTCGLTNEDGAMCWGQNSVGQLGDGSTTDRITPVNVAGLSSGAAAIAADDSSAHTCALTISGAVKCWGQNSSGELGDGGTMNRSAPVSVVGLASGVAAVTVGGVHTCAMTNGGGVKCWGYGVDGQIGDGSSTNQLTPVDVLGLNSGAAAIAAGDSHSCALTSGGGVKCWGYNSSGQLGDGTTMDRSAPTDVVGLSSGATDVDAGGYNTCALTSSGGVKCWGDNGVGQLGDGSTTSRLAPVDVVGMSSGVAAIAVGEGHTCALTSGGGVKCWGYNAYGQLGDNTTTGRLTPVDVLGMSSGVVAIAVGHWHTCALLSGGTVKCWGRNAYGQLGDGSTTDRWTPVQVSGFIDDVPDAFGFPAQTGVAPGATVTSNPITPTGYNTAASISVSNGEYSIGCSGSFSFAPGTISPGQSVCVRHIASSSPGATVTTTLTIGGVSGGFSSTTAAAGQFGLAVTRAGDGTVTSDPPGIDCGVTCSASYAVGTVVTLTGNPDVESTFTGWSGACTGTGFCTVAMTEPRSVTASFSFTPKTAEKIAALYVGFFFRAPDLGGLTFWKGYALASGLDDLALMKHIAAGFAMHPSFTSIYGGLDDPAFVDAIYLNVGGKLADVAGKAYWVGRLNTDLSRSGFVAEFLFYVLELTEQQLQDMYDQGQITWIELQDALARKARVANKTEVSRAFVEALGSATNMSPGTDPNDPASLEQDPVYRASQNIIREVTEDPASMDAPLTYLAGTPTIEGINETFGP